MRLRRTVVAVLVAIAGCLAVAPDAAAIDPCQIVPCPDANRPIFFTSNRYGGNYDIFRMNADGTQPVRLTTSPLKESQPSVNRDRTRIAFTAQNGTLRMIGIMASDLSSYLLIRGYGPSYDPSLSPDGGKIVFALDQPAAPELMVVDADGRNHRPLRPGQVIQGDRPAWSPNGLRVAYVHRVHEHNPPTTYFELRVVDVYTGIKHTIAVDAASSGGLSWSPDGQRIAYTAVGGEVHIADLTVSPPAVVRLTTGVYADRDPGWAPDGSRIVFTRLRGGRNELWSIKPNGTDARWFASGGSFTGEADWGYPVEPPIQTQ